MKSRMNLLLALALGLSTALRADVPSEGQTQALVMAVVGIALWVSSHHRRDGGDRGERRQRWLDTHHVDWMRHRH